MASRKRINHFIWGALTLSGALFIFQYFIGSQEIKSELSKESKQETNKHENLEQAEKRVQAKMIEELKKSETENFSKNQKAGAPESKAQSSHVSEAAEIDVSHLNEADQKKWSELHEILSSKNDNDPRIDRDFSQMSPDLHQVLQQKYQAIPLEQRNERGLIAFLIARDMKSLQDMDFLKDVYQEKPCLSLENCSSRTASDPHLSGINQASMNYPQLAALYQMEKQLTEHPERLQDPKFRDQAKAVLDQAARFPVPTVQQKAEELQRKLKL